MSPDGEIIVSARTIPSAEITRRLDALVEHGFVTRWEYRARRWRVVFGGTAVGVAESFDGWYTRAQVSAYIDGCRAMGAGI